MKKVLFLFIIPCILACKYDKNNISNSNSGTKKVSGSNSIENQHSYKKENYKPLFLTLNPKMPNDLFQYELENLHSDKKFIIPINNRNLPFHIEKGENRITLKFSNIQTKNFPDKFGEDAEFRFQIFINNEKSKANGEKMIADLIKIFQKKYPEKIENLPLVKNKNGEYYNSLSEIYNDLKGIQLIDFNFEKENYLIFQDSIKTVLIGFSNSELERKISDQDRKLAFYNPSPQISENGSTRSYEHIKEYFRNTSAYQLALDGTKFEDPITKKEGYELEINYLFNSDFKNLTDKLKKNYNRLQSKLKIKDSLADIKKTSIDQNIDQL